MTHGQERIHVTAILWIVANETKLPPMFVFEGNPFRLVVKNQKHSLVKRKQFFCILSKRLGIMKKKRLFFLRKYTNFDLKKTMLVLDDDLIHKIKG